MFVASDFSSILLSGGSAICAGNPLLPFIEQEALTLFCREEHQPILHVWRHKGAVLLGVRDRSLPHFSAGIQWVRARGYESVVRPFGGLAVPIDVGVVNVTLMIPGALSLDAGFSSLARVLQVACAEYGEMRVGEVTGSYCPGRFDLAINGLKVAGLAQRRIGQAIAVSAFVNVLRGIDDRENVIRTFYDVATNGGESPPWVPSFRAGAVGSLAQVAPEEDAVSVDDFLAHLFSPLTWRGSTLLFASDIPDRLLAEARKRMLERARRDEWLPAPGHGGDMSGN